MKTAFSVWYKNAAWPLTNVHRYIWVNDAKEAKTIGAKLLKTKQSNVNVLEMPFDFKTPYSYPS